MPYRVNPSNNREVQKLQDGRWWRVKVHETAEQARKQRDTLNINVTAKEGKGGL